jgi:DNA repair exonuclease SbcCD nuclease subunit
MDGERTVEASKDLGMHGDGIPIVGIHGTHERRPRKYTNPIELMAKTGHLHHLDNENIIFEKNGEKVAVHGMSGVPERYAPKVMEKFNPEPVQDAFNILVVHQSVEGFVFTPEDKDFLKLEDFPEGFDLIVNGHIHWYNTERFPGKRPLVLPGSTVTTQMRKIEAEKGKGFLRLDTENEELDFVELEKPRDVQYIEIEVNGENWSNVKEKAVKKLEEVASEDKPLVNLKITGETSGRVNPRELKNMFRDKMFLNVNSSVDSLEMRNSNIEETSEDPWEKGKNILQDKINSDIEIDGDEFLQLLENQRTDEAINILKDSVKET